MSERSPSAPPQPVSLREELIDAAAAVLRAEGPAAVTTRRIAEVAGCSEGSIYNHFQNKEELLGCVVSERIGGFLAIAREVEAAAGRGEVRDHLVRLAEAALGFYRDRADVLALALAEPGSWREQALTAHQQGFGPWRLLDRLSGWLRAEQRLGRVRADADPEAAITGLLGGCFHHAVLSRTWPAELAPPDEVAVSRAVGAVWPGLRPEDPPGRSGPAPGRPDPTR